MISILRNTRVLKNFKRCLSEFSKMEKVVTVYNEEESSITFSFQYKNEEFSLHRYFNMHRKANEPCSHLITRLTDNINKFLAKKLRKEKNKPSVQVNLVTKENQPLEDYNLSCHKAFIEQNNLLLMVGNTSYEFDINPPMIKNLELSKKNIMAQFMVYPIKLEVANCDTENVKYKWFRSKQTFDNLDAANIKLKNNLIEWEDIGEGFYINTTLNEVSKLIKVVAVPYNEDREGISYEYISKTLVSKAESELGLEKRHNFTKNVLGKDSIRVVSYNILADLYADSDFSRANLFPTCPHYALEIDYRKQLILKELIGYNADIICLQELDEKVYKRDLRPLLKTQGLNSIFKTKGGLSVSEGLGIFYREQKLILKDNLSFLLSEVIDSNPLFIDLSNKIKKLPEVYEIFLKRPTILQVAILNRVDDPNKVIIVGTTHLYFDPLSDHIRMLQMGVCTALLRQIMEMSICKSKEKPDISLLFCGDFNSAPENAIYRFMTSQYIDANDPDWLSKPGQEVKDIEFSHDLEMDSACGTPEFTNYTVGFKGCLDYIFYQSDKFDLIQSVPLPTEEELSEHGALPSVKFPSDHVALIADLKIK